MSLPAEHDIDIYTVLWSIHVHLKEKERNPTKKTRLERWTFRRQSFPFWKMNNQVIHFQVLGTFCKVDKTSVEVWFANRRSIFDEDSENAPWMEGMRVNYTASTQTMTFIRIALFYSGRRKKNVADLDPRQ